MRRGEARTTPDLAEIRRLAQDYHLIPVCREIYADITTPIALLRRIARISDRYFLLESVEGGEKWGRYSFLGFDPIAHVVLKDGELTIEDGQKRTLHTRKPYEALRSFLSAYKAPRLPGMPPFAGGFVGYFSYAMIGYAEPVLKLRSSEFNDLDLMLFDKVIAYDHLKQKISIVANMRTDRLEENYQKALDAIEDIVRVITDQAPLPETEAKTVPCFSCNVSKEEFCEMVQKTKVYIKAGDIFQAVISRRFEAEYASSLLDAYRVLRTTNPSPYMVFLQNRDLQLISTSPETLVRLQGRKLTTFPIAGTMPRGLTADEDLALEKHLLADEKELAEHDMLVDLARNDLGKISEYGSVRVTQYRAIQRYSRVMHITSEVEGRIRKDRDALDAIEALLPAGTLSGAPKIRACEIIEELEKAPRGIYGGAIGYIDFTGNMDACIAIRMAVKKDGKVYVQAGGGVVADSIAEREYEESGNKAKAVIEAIMAAGEVDA
ncbi:anthranilate synthase component I [Thermoclostridium caenicola]|uniref:Anthranilate synthase component 1 n=1 Tax=Thermoclostridium caenicola TaxID=659425 RepID=A0A1M6CGI3_9FIRM|nr:anthranilate synthase component I [Thermoclostridium caenicola]SHI59854.1 anthranilate synthase component 1 [Thermoclostridium caenicola]HOP72048.1 anthranilate synthase component I [Thermoclostridium caenicola]